MRSISFAGLQGRMEKSKLLWESNNGFRSYLGGKWGPALPKPSHLPSWGPGQAEPLWHVVEKPCSGWNVFPWLLRRKKRFWNHASCKLGVGCGCVEEWLQEKATSEGFSSPVLSPLAINLWVCLSIWLHRCRVGKRPGITSCLSEK